jgi:hypothetical protein
VRGHHRRQQGRATPCIRDVPPVVMPCRTSLCYAVLYSTVHLACSSAVILHFLCYSLDVLCLCRHKPWLLAVGGSDDVLRVYDRRMGTGRNSTGRSSNRPATCKVRISGFGVGVQTQVQRFQEKSYLPLGTTHPTLWL